MQRSMGGGMAGRRAPAQIGLAALSTDLILEGAFHRVCRGLPVKIFTNRIAFKNPLTPQNLAKMKGGIAHCIANLMPDEKLDAVVYGCTSGVVTIGAEAVAREIRRHRPRCLVIDPANAAARALKKLGKTQMAVFSPYIAATHRPLVSWFVKNGIAVPDHFCMGIRSDLAVARLNEAALRKKIAAFKTDAKVVFLSCTNLPALGLLERLERETGKIYIASAQALIWDALRAAKIKTKIKGYGKLLAT